MPDSGWLFSLRLDLTRCLNVVCGFACLLFFCHETGVGGHGALLFLPSYIYLGKSFMNAQQARAKKGYE